MPTIDPEKWQRAKAIFYDAMDRAPADRDGFVIDACEGDALLVERFVRGVALHACGLGINGDGHFIPFFINGFCLIR